MPSEAVERVLSRLWALDCNPRGNETAGWNSKCPAHDDRSPSFKLDQAADDGRALVYCHAGCTIDQIAASMSMDVRELFEPELESIERIVLERYDYTDEQGVMLFQVERMSPKGFRQRKPDGRGGWEYSLGSTRRVLYRLPKVVQAVKQGALICLVEGEKDVHTLEAKGKVATTMPGGAGKWRKEYTETLRGANVVIIQDRDEIDPKTCKRPGQEHAEMVRQKLDGVARKVKVLEPAVGKDVTDHVKAGLPLSRLVEPGAARPPASRMEVLSAKEIMALPDPDTEGYLLGPLLYRGHRIVVGGWTGHGKTTFCLHMTAAACYGRDFLGFEGRGDLRALVVDVEQGTRTIKRRIRETGLEDSDRVKYLRVPDGLALDSDKDAILAMERIFHDGHYDLVLCDPLYKLHRSDPNDTRAATDLMRRFDDWRERFGFSLVLPMHCRKPQADSQLSPHDLFGSSAWQWGAEMLLGIQRKSKSLSWLHWWKDREGEVTDERATIGSHWDLLFEREKGFWLHNNNQQGQLIEVAPTPRFSLPQFIYEQIRDSGPVTRQNIRDRAYTQFHATYTYPQIDRALANVGGYGVISNGAPLKKDRVYFLQDELLQAEGPGEPGPHIPPTPTTAEKGDGA